jgi:hypothetical protein
LVHRAQLDLKAYVDLEVFQVKMVQQVQLVQMDLKDYRGYRGMMELPVPLACRV